MGYTFKVYNNLTGEIVEGKVPLILRASAELISKRAKERMIDELTVNPSKREQYAQQIEITIEEV